MNDRKPDPNRSTQTLPPDAPPDSRASSSQQREGNGEQNGQKNAFQPPVINLPKGGGAIQGIGEKFQANPVTGTGSMTVPIAMSQGRGGFTPQLTLSYDSGAGNSAFGLGWNIGLPSISRKTSKGLPQYDGLPKYYDAFESDVFILSGAEDLIPKLNDDRSRYKRTKGDYTVYRYIPRIEGLFARIEKWVKNNDKSSFWKSVTKENITTIYGQSDAAKIADPEAPWKVFQWKIEKSWDDKGNVIVYEYKQEDGASLSPKPIFEKNRTADNAYVQTYLKRVLYGNTEPYLKRNANFDEVVWENQNEWLFELLLDYGEHFQDTDEVPFYDEEYNWQIRPDMFSSFRSGFDIRTYRLCRQILMYHHFEQELGIPHYLVKSTRFGLDENPIATQLKTITHTGYRWDGSAYIQKSFPPVEFQYTEQKIDESIYTIQSSELPNAPQGIDGQNYQFNDLFGEGLPGILSQKGGAWYYKRNEGDGKFGAQRQVAEIPSLAVNAQVQISDYGGNGLTDVLVQNNTLNGYYELNEEHEWSAFKPFNHPLNINLNDPNIRMLDLDGNGIADILLTENDCMVWYAADAKDGYKAARRVAKALDEEQGPRIVFNESFQTIFLADMSGDGLTDIVRIRNGEICYWANQGYGRFSHKITMAQAPVFDHADYFDPARIRLADIDGSGSIDVVYLGRAEIQYWLNQSGNSWREPLSIRHFPKTSNLDTVSVLDLEANGTSCIVWSSPLPAQANTPMKYIRLMGETEKEGNKPYLLKEINNHMGALTRLKYQASTKFYLQDRKAGNPWITKLPFPVQVLVRQEVLDQLTENHFVSNYAYHHGYFDKTEREFRGFGMVEQWDTEDYETLAQNTLFDIPGQNWQEEVDIMPPIHTKTWFHNGYYQLGGKISRQYENEYYDGDPDAWPMPDTEWPDGLNPEEKMEAARALKGRILRSEVYGLDGSADEQHPYTVTETKYHLKTIQHKGDNRHASFYACECETMSYHYERNPADPRIAHQSTLEIDEFGNVLKSAAIVYPRRIATDYDEQKQTYITYTEAEFINKAGETDYYRIGIPCAQRSYEITGLNLPFPFTKNDLKQHIAVASPIPYEQAPASGVEKRLLSFSKSSFYKEDLSGELAFGEIAFHALPYHAYEAVYTQGLIDKFKKDGNTLITSAEIENQAGFISMNGLWWRTSGRAVFDPDHFYLPIEQRDPYGHVYEMAYDSYHLAMTETRTALNSLTIHSQAALNYRTLQPYQLTDPNGNSSKVIFDELGLVIATAISGKNGEGDHLNGFQRPDELRTNLDQDMRQEIYDHQTAFLQTASSFFYYDLHAWERDGQPNYAVSIVRETHVVDENGTPSNTQINFSYSDGFGQAIMVKAQAEPGDAYDIISGSMTSANPRWVGNGRTVFNNKGNPVKQYEPFFSYSFGYETETELVEFGVTPILHYDPLGRNIRTDLPDGTYTQVAFTPWQQITWDQNDTVMDSAWKAAKDASVNPYENRAANLASTHANTPKVEHLDTQGRVFLMVDDDGSADKVKTHFKLDIAGNQLEVIDAKGRLITCNHFNMANEPIQTGSMDAGYRWMLNNIMGNPLYQWNDRNFRTRLEYDDLQRNIKTWLADKNAPEELVYHMIYGESHTNPASINLIGQLWQLYDQSGLLTNDGYDFKGNPLSLTKQIAEDYQNRLDWSASTAPVLETETFTTSTQFDALNRPLVSTAPDGAKTAYTYNEANFLQSVAFSPAGGGAGGGKIIVSNIDYDAKGQRTRIQYGNGVTSRYTYDPHTFRLTRLRSTRNSGADVLQDLQYYYDPVGNITDLRDDAQQTLFFQNTVVEPHSSYTYDALYRLIEAKGREHPGQNVAPGRTHEDLVPSTPIPHANDGQAMQLYTRTYEYDKQGNILSVNHAAGSNGWSRTYSYNEASLLEPSKMSNRLSATISLAGGGTGGGITASYTHDIHGNMTSMPHLPEMLWDFADQLREVQLDLASNREYYTYTIGGGKDFGVRTRKVTHHGTITKDRIYLGDYEIYRERKADGTIELERSTHHIQDDNGRITLIDTLIEDTSPFGGGAGGGIIGQPVYRYILSNHLGSATLELDDMGAVISYGEYYPFGASSYRAGRTVAEVGLKRYRYVGKERDEGTGLDYYGARYYASWMGRWCSADPAGFVDGFNLFHFVNNNPIKLVDLIGKRSNDPPIYTVKKGDNLWNIAKAQLGEKAKPNEINELVNEIVEWNKIDDPDFILPNTELLTGESKDNNIKALHYEWNNNTTLIEFPRTEDYSIEVTNAGTDNYVEGDNENQEDLIGDLWNSSAARSVISDYYSIGLNSHVSAFLGVGTTPIKFTILTRGEPGLYFTPGIDASLGTGISGTATIGVETGLFTGDPRDIEASFLEGHSLGVSVGLGAELAGSVGLSYAPVNINNPLEGGFIITGAQIGVGIEGSPTTGVNVELNYQYTPIVEPIIQFNKK